MSDPTLFIAQICTVIITIVGFAYQWFKDGRQRKWDMEDRKAARRKSDEANIKVLDKIDENTDISKQAFHEANSAKQLIANVEEVRNKLQNRTIEIFSDIKDKIKDVKDSTAKIEDTTQKTADVVNEMNGGKK